MVYVNYGKLILEGDNTCKECGYASSEAEAFMILTDGMLCHDCYDRACHLKDEDLRKSEAVAYAINVDYLDQEKICLISG